MRLRALLFSGVAASAIFVAACSTGPKPAPAPACDQACRDGNALLAMRDILKLAFNLTLQGKPVGTHDETTPCLSGGGKARVYGTATSNATQGTTEVHLTYELDHCNYLQKSTTPAQNYSMALTGKIVEDGTLSAQPSSTSAVIFKSDGLTFSGTVYDPPQDYQESCPLELAQNGNQLAGTLCGRAAGTSL